MKNYKLEREINEQCCLGEVHVGDEAPHLSLVPSKKKKKKKLKLQFAGL
jgi:hypothetical protein